MNNKITYIALSSDSRELYKADVYRILAKPNYSIEHFRYQEKWIDTSNDNDCITYEKLIGSEVILFFKDSQKSLYLPIRKAIIKDFFYDKETEVYHYYFELLDFCKIIGNLKFDNKIFFYKFINVQSEKVIWKDTIESLKIYFSDKVFYKIDGLTANSRNILGKLYDLCTKSKEERKNYLGHYRKLKYNKINNSYFYSLKQGKEYSLILSIANPNESKSTLTLKSSTSDVNIILSEEYEFSVPYDKIKIPVTTKNIDSYKEKSFLSFYLKNDNKDLFNEYENHIHINKKINFSRPLIFGICSTLLIVLTWLIKEKTKQIENIACWDCSVNWESIMYIFFIFLLSSYLLAVYNKK